MATSETLKRAARAAESGGRHGLLGLVAFGVKYVVSFYLNFLAQFLAPHPFLRVWLQRRRGAHIGKDVILAPYALIDLVYPELVTIEDGVAIAPGAKIFCHHRSSNRLAEQGLQHDQVAPVVIRAHSMIGTGAVILPGVSVGPCSVVMPNSVVHQDVPEYCVVGGIPARVMRRMTPPEAQS